MSKYKITMIDIDNDDVVHRGPHSTADSEAVLNLYVKDAIKMGVSAVLIEVETIDPKGG